MSNKRYLKYRFKMQKKFDELFGNKKYEEMGEIKIMKEYTTKSFFVQCMIADIKDVRIVGFERDKEENRERITYEFELDNKEAIKCISNCMEKVYEGIEIPNFKEKKENRRKMINNYFNDLKKDKKVDK